MTRALLSLAASVAILLAFVAPSGCSVADLDVSAKACPCGTGWVCDGAQNKCVRQDSLPLFDGSVGASDAGDGAAACVGEGCPCVDARDCTDPAFSKCVGGKCAECTLQPDSCPANKYCLAQFNACAPGCKLDAECASLGGPLKFCNTARHQCVECAGDGDCTGGKKCSPSGACVDTCTGTCAVGTCCNGLCIDTTKDIANCGGCGVACTGAQTQCCSSKCADPLTNTGNCGGCGNTCSNVNATPGCQAGSCKPTCNAGFLHCATGNTGCETNGATDTLHCGSCTTNCNNTVVHATGVSCAASACTYAACAAPWVDANGRKTDGCEVDGTACGGGGQVCCQPGNTCNAGYHCELPPANDGKCH